MFRFNCTLVFAFLPLLADVFLVFLFSVSQCHLTQVQTFSVDINDSVIYSVVHMDNRLHKQFQNSK